MNVQIYKALLPVVRETLPDVFNYLAIKGTWSKSYYMALLYFYERGDLFDIKRHRPVYITNFYF